MEKMANSAVYVAYHKAGVLQNIFGLALKSREYVTRLIKKSRWIQECLSFSRKFQPWVSTVINWHMSSDYGPVVMSSNENVFRVTGLLCGEFTGHRWRPVTRSFDIFFDLRLNRRLSKNREDGDLKRHRGHYEVSVMIIHLGIVDK